MIISKAEKSDLPAILQLQYAAFQSEAEMYGQTIPPLEQSLSELEEEFDRGIILKATVNGEIVGSVRALVQDGVCIISKLIVMPAFQNQGIGNKLFSEMEEQYSTAKRKELFTGHKSTKNLALYTRLGYQIFKEVAVNDNLTLIYMCKEG